MTIEIKDNDKIASLIESQTILENLQHSMIVAFEINIESHVNKIVKLIDSAIKKERIAILNSEIDKIKKGVSDAK